jgi:hypothetical protein
MNFLVALLPSYGSSNTVCTHSIRKERSMIQAPSPTSKPRNSYELVGRRLQRIIASPRVQRIQLVEVSRRDDESPEAWHQVIQDIGDTAGIRIEHLDDGAVRIGWREYCDY